MDEFEDLVNSLEAAGYFPHVRRSGKAEERQWEVLIACGVDKIPPYQPRPEAKATTLLEALQLAAKKVKVKV